MLNAELIKQLQGFGKDADRVLIEFPDVGGPYRSPSDLVPVIGTSNTIIETVYPRNGTIVRDFFIKLMDHPLGGEVRLFLNQGGPHPIAYYNVGKVYVHRAGIVLVAGSKI